MLRALEQFAPLPLQEGFDNAGLQVGLTEVEVSGALLCLDVTGDVLNEAINTGCNLVVAHHPLIFHKLARVADENMVQRIVRNAIQNGITIVAMHTNIDAAEGGVNHKIAEKLGLQNLRPIGKEKQVGTVCGSDGIIGSLPHLPGSSSNCLKQDSMLNVYRPTSSCSVILNGLPCAAGLAHSCWMTP